MLSELDRLIASRGAALDRPVIVALDGRSGTGKSTLAAEIAASNKGQAVTADDFWGGADLDQLLSLSPPERAAICIDWRRLRVDVLEPLRSGLTARWRTFNWDTGTGLGEQELSCAPLPVIVLDGAYSARPELSDLIDVSVLVTLDDSTRRARLVHREGLAYMTEWHSLWDAAEDYYFQTVRPAATFDLVVSRDAS